jgi:predicted Rossmann-fold nucleotide-binding protein
VVGRFAGVKSSRGRVIEVDSAEELDERLAAGATSLSGWHLHSIDLTGRGETLRSVRVSGALFLGCTFDDGDEAAVLSRGGIVFPVVPGLPVDAYRSQLYSPTELYDTTDYQDSFDARAYAWSRRPADHDSTLAAALHDHAIDEALAAWVATRRLVGVMGGHSAERGSVEYAAAARLGRALAATHVVATGGGPGAMEAANLGAWLSTQEAAALDEAQALLVRVPDFRPDIGAWARVALDVLARFPGGAESLGIPTWHYGHEPSNPFATAIAKYFHNPDREAILLEVCDAGIVFLPGAAGTVQEIFQDACENYYADESSVASMVLVGVEHWTTTVPAWPLLQALSAGRPMEAHVHLVDSVDEAAELMVAR